MIKGLRILAAASLLSCCPAVVLAQMPANEMQQQQAAVLKVLTWNIWMMPEFTHTSPNNTRRAAAIADELSEQDVDILCLEKAFDDDARRVIAARLRTKFPYMYGPANQKPGLKTNSGVWVLSRLPLSSQQETEFRDCAGVECFARKGAISLQGEEGGIGSC